MARTFSSARGSANFRRYLFGNTVSAIGIWIHFTASAWLVLELTDDGRALGLQVAMYFAPVLLLAAWGGVLADRFDKRRILLITQSAYAVLALSLWLVVATDAVQLWMVFGLSLASGVVTAVDNPTRQSFFVEMVGADQVKNAVSLHSAAFTGARIVGPAVAGALIATVGIAACFLIDGLSYLAVLAAIVLIRPADLHPQPRTDRERGHMVAGLRYVWATDALRRPLVVMAVAFTFAFNFAVFVPLLAERTFGGDASTFGTLSALAGLGSFIGALVLAGRAASPSLRLLAIWSTAVGASLLVVGVAPTLFLAAVSMVPLGFSAMGFMITGNTMLQLNARPQARGRVMALYGIVFLGSTPIGSPIAGLIGEHLGARAGFVFSGMVAGGLGLGLLWVRRRRLASAGVEAPGAVPV